MKRDNRGGAAKRRLTWRLWYGGGGRYAIRSRYVRWAKYQYGTGKAVEGMARAAAAVKALTASEMVSLCWLRRHIVKKAGAGSISKKA
jgi:hypothetical protein